MLASLSGKLFTYGVFRNIIQRNIRFLVTFSLGVFLATEYVLIKEVQESETSFIYIIIAMMLGALLLEILQHFLPDAHHHHGADESECYNTHECQSTHNHKEVHPESKINPRRILLGDAVHNIADGILLVPAYLISINTGITLTIGILVHEFIQETSEFFILKEAGYSTKRALISNFIVSSAILVGILTGITVSKATDYIPLLMAFSIGALLYIIIRDLLPHIIARMRNDGQVFRHILTLILGIYTIFFIEYILLR